MILACPEGRGACLAKHGKVLRQDKVLAPTSSLRPSPPKRPPISPVTIAASGQARHHTHGHAQGPATSPSPVNQSVTHPSAHACTHAPDTARAGQGSAAGMSMGMGMGMYTRCAAAGYLAGVLTTRQARLSPSLPFFSFQPKINNANKPARFPSRITRHSPRGSRRQPCQPCYLLLCPQVAVRLHTSQSYRHGSSIASGTYLEVASSARCPV